MATAAAAAVVVSAVEVSATAAASRAVCSESVASEDSSSGIAGVATAAARDFPEGRGVKEDLAAGCLSSGYMLFFLVPASGSRLIQAEMRVIASKSRAVKPYAVCVP